MWSCCRIEHVADVKLCVITLVVLFYEINTPPISVGFVDT